MNNTVNLTIRINKDLKKETDNLFRDLGINTSAAITLFLKQCHREQGLPFKASLTPAPGRQLRKALKEAEKMRTGKKQSKGYHNIHELVRDLSK